MGKATIPQSALRLTPLTRPSPSVAARHLPTLWGVALCTREPLVYHPQIGNYPVRARLSAKTMADSQQSWPIRAVQCPTGALIAVRPRNNEHRPLQNG